MACDWHFPVISERGDVQAADRPKSKGLHKRQQRVSLRSEDESSGSIYQKCGPAAPAGPLVRRKDADPLCVGECPEARINVGVSTCRTCGAEAQWPLTSCSGALYTPRSQEETFQSDFVSTRNALWVSLTDLAVTTGQWADDVCPVPSSPWSARPRHPPQLSCEE